MFNEAVGLEGRRLRLVPYLPQHVPRYHEWMCDPDILHATESEPLSLEEEIENQQSWLTSDDKLTFIILAPLSLVVPAQSESASESSTVVAEAIKASGRIVPSTASAESSNISSEYASKSISDVFVMIGDCNLFLLPNMDEEEEEEEDDKVEAGDSATLETSSKKKKRKCSFEVEVMVADKQFRGKGVAQEAVRLIVSYAMDALQAEHFVAKILDSNLASLALFQDKLGFKKFAEIRVFNEIHLDLTVASEADQEAWRQSCGYKRGKYMSLAERTVVLEAVPPLLLNA